MLRIGQTSKKSMTVHGLAVAVGGTHEAGHGRGALNEAVSKLTIIFEELFKRRWCDIRHDDPFGRLLRAFTNSSIEPADVNGVRTTPKKDAAKQPKRRLPPPLPPRAHSAKPIIEEVVESSDDDASKKPKPDTAQDMNLNESTPLVSKEVDPSENGTEKQTGNI